MGSMVTMVKVDIMKVDIMKNIIVNQAKACLLQLLGKVRVLPALTTLLLLMRLAGSVVLTK
jgi:hypothetical protein